MKTQYFFFCLHPKVSAFFRLKIFGYKLKKNPDDFFMGSIQGPEYVENISSRSLKKTSDQRKLRLLSVYFFIFE